MPRRNKKADETAKTTTERELTAEEIEASYAVLATDEGYGHRTHRARYGRSRTDEG